MLRLFSPVALLVANLLAVTSAPAQNRTDIEKSNVETVLELFEDGWGTRPGWDDIWQSTMSPDVRTYFHAFPPNEGIESAIAFNRDLFTGFPALEMTVEDVTAEGDAVVVRGRLVGRHTGPFLGIPATGETVDVPDVTMFRLEDGKVVESRYFTDLVHVLTAIGAIPPMQ